VRTQNYFLDPGEQGWALAMFTRGFFVIDNAYGKGVQIRNAYSYDDAKAHGNLTCSLSGVYPLKYGDPGGKANAINWFKGASARGNSLAYTFWLIEHSKLKKPWPEETKEEVRAQIWNFIAEINEALIKDIPVFWDEEKATPKSKRKTRKHFKNSDSRRRVSEKEALLALARKLGAQNPLASYYKGVFMEKAGDQEKAVAAWKEAPESAACLYKLAASNLNNKDEFLKIIKNAAKKQRLSERRYLKAFFDVSRKSVSAICDYRERELKLYNFDPVKIYFIKDYFDENANENYKKGVRALVDGKDKEALKSFLVAGKEGCVHSCLCCGLANFYGIGVEKNRTDALKCFKIASNLKDADAMFFAGMMQFFGIGVPRNQGNAVGFICLAARKGLNSAQYAFAYLLDAPKCSKKKACQILTHLAKDKDDGGEAMYKLSEMLMEGKDCKKNPALALKYLKMAASEDYALALYKLGDMYYRGIGVPPSKTEAARYWKRALALDGETPDRVFTNKTSENFIVPIQVLRF
jgi:TPR repeat protein